MMPKNVKLTGLHPLAYMGVDPSTPPQMLIEKKSPTVNDYSNVNVGTIWVVSDDSTQSYEYWVLINLNTGYAHWIQLYPGASGGATSIPCDIGTATVASGVLKIIGGLNTTTTGSGNTVVCDLDTNVNIVGTLNVGSLVPTAGVVSTDVNGRLSSSNGNDGMVLIGATGGTPAWAHLTAGANVTIVPGPNTITISSSGGGGGGSVNSLSGDTGIAVPDLSGNIKIKSGANIVTSAPASPGDTVFVAVTDVIDLPTTAITGTAGVYSINSVPFVQGYGTENAFIGGAGNFTLTTASAVGNTGLGMAALLDLTTSAYNTALGGGSLTLLAGGNGNNTALGTQALGALVSGDHCTGIGYQSGIHYNAGESSNIAIANPGVAGESNVLRIGQQGSSTGEQNTAYISGIYGGTVGATNGIVTVDNTGKLGSSSGARGQVIIGGTTGAAWANFTSSDSSIIFTVGENQLDMVAVGGGGGGGITKLGDDNGAYALPILGAVDIIGGANINTVASTNIVTVSLHDWVSLPVTNATGTAGGISLGGSRFMHAIGTRNTFLGQIAGNLGTLTAYSDDNVGIGYGVMPSVVRAHQNVGVGSYALGALTATGSSAGNDNVAVGYKALAAMNVTSTGGNGNTAIGSQSGLTLSTGTNNCFLGYSTGSNITTGMNDIYLGYNIDGATATESNYTRIGNSGTTNTYIAGIYGAGPDVAAGVSKFIVMTDSTDKLYQGLTGGGTSNGSILSTYTDSLGVKQPIWANITSTGGNLTITTSPTTGNVDIELTSIPTPVCGSKAFAFYQPSITGTVIGNIVGSTYYLGSSVALSSAGVGYDNTAGAFYAGSGSGSPATYTAPATGVYYFNIAAVVGNLNAVGIADTNMQFAVTIVVTGTNAGSYNWVYTLTPEDVGSGWISGHDQTTLQFAQAIKMTLGDIAKFSCYGIVAGLTNPSFTIGPVATNSLTINGTFVSGYRVI